MRAIFLLLALAAAGSCLAQTDVYPQFESDKLPASVWTHYDWSISHCVLRGDNTPIQP